MKAPGCRSDQIDLQDKPEAACQLAPSQVFLVTTLAGSDPQPGQSPLLSRHAWPGWDKGPRHGSQGDLGWTWPASGSQVQPWGTRGTQPQPRLHCMPFKSLGRSKPSPGARKRAMTPHPSPGKGDSSLSPASETLGQGGCYSPRRVIWPFLPHPALRGAPGKLGSTHAGRSDHSGFLSPSQSQHRSEDDRDSHSCQRQPGPRAALRRGIILLSPPLPLSPSRRPAGCQQSRFAEPGQIRPGTKLSCCKASKRPLTAGRLEPPRPLWAAAQCPPSRGLQRGPGPGRAQGDETERNWAGSRVPHSAQETRGQATLPEQC